MAPKMTVSTISAEGASMTIENTNHLENVERKPNPIGQWLKRETTGMFSDLRLAQELTRATLGDPETLIDHDPEYLKAEDFKRTMTPTANDADHDWVWDYAKFQFERADRIYKDLDDKANDIIKYLVPAATGKSAHTGCTC